MLVCRAAGFFISVVSPADITAGHSLDNGDRWFYALPVGWLGGNPVLTQRRFRKSENGRAADLWVDIGLLRYDVELYENGHFAKRQRGWRRSGEIEAHLVGQDFAALVRIDSTGKVGCTWAR